MDNKQWGGKRPGAGRPRTKQTIRASKAEQQTIIRATLIFTNLYHNFPDNLEGCYKATKQALMDEGESEYTAMEIARTIAELFQTPFYGAPQLPEELKTVLAILTPERTQVATIYRKLGWTRHHFETVINTHRDTLANVGVQLHVATKDAASGRQDRYITVDGTRYSTLSRQ